MLKQISLLVLSCVYGQLMVAQDSASTFVPKSIKIGFLEPSRTVGKGNFLLEAGMSFYQEKRKYGNESYQTHFLNTPKLKLRYGIAKNVEIFVEQNNYIRDYSYSENFHTTIYGAGVKLNLTQQKGWLPNSSLTITQQYFNSTWLRDGYRTEATFAWDHDLGRRFNLAGNFIYSWINPDYYELGLGLKVTYKVNPKLNLYMDWYLAEVGYDFSIFNIGASYQLSPRLSIFANAGTNHWVVNEVSRGGSFNASIGVSFLLKNPNKKKKSRRKK